MKRYDAPARGNLLIVSKQERDRILRERAEGTYPDFPESPLVTVKVEEQIAKRSE